MAILTQSDIKILILFILNELEYPLSEQELSDIISESGYAHPFDFAELFSSLVDKKHIVVFQQDDMDYYGISESGKMVARELESSLLESIRENSRKIAVRYLSLTRKGAKPQATIETTDDGYLVKCTILGREGILAEFITRVSSMEYAESIKNNFLRSPESVWKGCQAVLSGKINEYLN